MSAVLKVEDIKASVEKVAKEYGIIRKASLFGSYASGNPTKKSDIDLLVEFGPRPITLFQIIEVQQRLEDLTKKKVDVISVPIKPDDLFEIKEEIPMYG